MMQNQKPSKIPYIFIAFFAVVFVVDFFYIYISQKTWRGISTQDSYQKGLKYNQIILEEKKQQLLGWKMDVKYRNDGQKNGILVINLVDKNSIKIKNAKIIANFKRPTQEGLDFSQDLEFKNNEYIAKISFPLRGQWDFEITAIKDQNIMQEVRRYVVQ